MENISKDEFNINEELIDNKKEKNKKSLFTVFLDIIIALTFVTTIALGAKYSYETFYSDLRTKQANAEFERVLNAQETITREEFKPVVGEVAFRLKIDGLTDWIPVITDNATSLVNLERGAIHLEQTGMPTDERQIFTAGHRGTHYHNIDKANPGTTIFVQTLYGEFEYVVSHHIIVPETQVDVIKTEYLGEDELVLMTCYPFGDWSTNDERYLVYAYPKGSKKVEQYEKTDDETETDSE